MEIELIPTVSLLPETNSLLIAPWSCWPALSIVT
jgi:hypothetical protein